jgi:hypothetical protein
MLVDPLISLRFPVSRSNVERGPAQITSARRGPQAFHWFELLFFYELKAKVFTSLKTKIPRGLAKLESIQVIIPEIKFPPPDEGSTSIPTGAVDAPTTNQPEQEPEIGKLRPISLFCGCNIPSQHQHQAKAE